MEKNRRNLALLYAVYFLQGLVFYSPVATLYRQAAGLDLLQIGTIESISLAVMLSLEAPWGAVADRLGYRRVLVAASFLFALSKVVFWRADSFGDFLAERILLGICLAGLSGCDSAFLFACCRAEEHRAVYARWEAVQTLGMLSASLAWPLMGGDYRLSALLTVATYTAAALLTLFLREPEGARAQAARTAEPLAFRAAARHTLAMAPVLLGFCLVRECIQTVTVFFAPLQYAAAGIPQRWFGLLQACATAAGLVSGLSHRLLRRLGEGPAGGGLMAAAAAACLLPALWRSPFAAVAAVMALRAAGGLLGPLALTVQNERAAPAGRATQLSCNAILMDLGAMGLYPLLGARAEGGLSNGLLLAAACCGGGALLYLWGLAHSPAKQSIE